MTALTLLFAFYIGPVLAAHALLPKREARPAS